MEVRPVRTRPIFQGVSQVGMIAARHTVTGLWWHMLEDDYPDFPRL